MRKEHAYVWKMEGDFFLKYLLKMNKSTVENGIKLAENDDENVMKLAENDVENVVWKNINDLK